MNTFRLIFISLFLLSVSNISLLATEKKHPKKFITVRADQWMPYNGQPNTKNPGYMIEIAEFAFKQQGYTLDYQLMPWERSLEMVGKGEIDCVVGAFKSDARNFVFHEKSFGKEDVAFYGRIDARAWKYENLDSFKDYTLGVIGGYSYGPEIDFYVANPNNPVHIAKGNDALERNMKMLLTKRIDILVESPAVFEYKIKNQPGRINIKELDRRNKPDDLYFACSPANTESENYARFLDEGIESLRKSGKLKKMLAKYGLRDWE